MQLMDIHEKIGPDSQGSTILSYNKNKRVREAKLTL